MEPQHTVLGTTVRRQPRSRLKYRKHGCLKPGDLSQNSPCLAAQLDIGLGSNAVSDQHKYLPAGVRSDRGGVDREILNIGQLVFTSEKAIQLAADGSPFAFNPRRPRKRGIVVKDGVSEPGISQVQPLGEGNHQHQKPRDNARPRHRRDSLGGPALMGHPWPRPSDGLGRWRSLGWLVHGSRAGLRRPVAPDLSFPCLGVAGAGSWFAGSTFSAFGTGAP